MTTISGFTFIHNAIESGYPIVEAIRAVQPYVDEMVAVDMQSTDDTRRALLKLADSSVGGGPRHRYCNCAPIRIIDGLWGTQAGETLRQAHSKYKECSGDVIVHFEADEVYDDRLVRKIVELINDDQTDIAVHRLQIEQNFQRCRWYPEPVHRIFPRLSNTRKDGHTTSRHNEAIVLEPNNGFLWDITNCFRDNWLNRVSKQAELRNEQPQYLMVPIHTTFPAETGEDKVRRWLLGPHWQWTETPFNIPEILRSLVGATKYEVKI